MYGLDYDKDNADSYMSLSSMGTSGKVYLGFNERLSGIKVYMAPEYENSNIGTLTVSYWNGSAWTAVTGQIDGTSVGGKTLNRTGVISWDAPAASSEFTTSVANSAKWYYYRFTFSSTPVGSLWQSVRIDHFAGLPVQTVVPAHRYPVLWNNRLS